MDGSNLDIVLKNIKDFAQAKKELNSFTPILSFHYIVSKENIHEAEMFLDLVHSLNIDIFEVYYTPLMHGFEEIKTSFLEEFPEELKQKLEKKARELGIHVGFNLIAKHNKPQIKNCTSWIMPFVFVNGDVIPCCAENEANKRDFQKKHAMGNVFEKNFRDM